MAATVALVENNGASPGTATTNPANLNFGSTDAPALVPASYPITAQADGHAFEKWFRLYVSAMGGSSIVDNVKIWKSSGNYKTDEGISTNARESGYSQATYPGGGPIETNSSVATQVLPTSEPSGANVGIGGSLSGQITTPLQYTDWIVLQLDVTASTPAGALNQKVITLQWDEQ